MTGPGAPLHIEVGADSLIIVGEIDAHTVDLLTEVLVPVPSSGDARLDLEAVTFIDSSGMRVLLDVHRQMAADGRRLILLRPSASVVRLLEITGLVGHLHTEPPIERPVETVN